MIPAHDTVVCAFPGNERVGFDVAMSIGAELGLMEWRHFPDGESHVRLLTDPRGREVIIVATQHRPDEQFLALAFLADAARELGAVRVGLLAPYLAYLRQDRRFRRGDAVSSRSFARLLSRVVDWMVTADPHLHRLTSLAEVYDIPARAVDVAPALGAWVQANVEAPLIVGPDSESERWARAVAAAAGAPLLMLSKVRRGDADVQVRLPATLPGRSHTPVLVDDIISTGRTAADAARRLRDAGFRAPVCAAVHALFAGNAEEELARAGIARVVTSNTIRHPTNAIDVVPALVAAIPHGARPPGPAGARRTPREMPHTEGSAR